MINMFYKCVAYVVFLVCITGCAKSDLNKSENGNSQHDVTVKFDFDDQSLIRNPGMGWTMYDDGNGEVANATAYWNLQDDPARKYASCFYIRWRWSDMEPEEGKYAWKYDANFKALIKGALDRGLKLAFCIYMDGQDNLRPGTPDFVFDAGAKYYEVTAGSGGNGIHRTPYADDPVFRDKFSNFIHAFAAEFDNPEIVDYVDGYNLGWWGEGHHVKYLNASANVSTFEWITNLYGNSFKKVQLVLTMGSEMGIDAERTYGFKGQDYSPRRNSYGSFWFPESQKALMRGFFPDKMIVAEAAFWGGSGNLAQINQIDPVYDWDSWGDYYKQVVNEALSLHANYLDLRETLETSRYVTEALDQVKKFMVNGGYRFYPNEISFSGKVEANADLSISHEWKNMGVSIIPNNNKRWNYKYKLMFSLLDNNNNVVKKWQAKDAEPSSWLKSKINKYNESFNTSGLPKGTYTLAVAIVNKENNEAPAINLAVKDKSLITSSGWLKLNNISIL